jgi:hypothetical protein
MILGVLAGLAGLVAVIGWLVAAVHAFLLLGHVAPPNTTFGLLFRGYKFFLSDTFLPSGHPLQRRMLIGMGVFFAGAVGAGVLGAIGSALG